MFDLTGRVALITGAAGLLGWEHAKVLAQAGAHVILVDINSDRCAERAAELARQNSVRTLAARCDVADRSSWQTVTDQAIHDFGRIDILINNAAYTSDSRSPNYGAKFEDFPLEDWHNIMAVNLTGTFLGCQIVGRTMLAAGKGTIINVSSLYGVVSPHHRIYAGTGVAQPIAYSVSKTAVLGLTRYLAALWAEKGVRVNALTPGGVWNEQDGTFVNRYKELSPIGRLANRDEMSGAVIYLASDASSYCTGHNLVVDGGWTAW